jgi:hypothetical protein
MADEPLVIRGINWRETFPFTNLFRAFRVAVHPSKLVLGLILLLGIYASGRILDGIWPARHLAIPSEAGAYETANKTGKSSEQYLAARREVRRSMEAEYADLLVERGVVADRAAALKAAENGDKLGALKDKIIERRDKAVADAEKARETALANVKTLPPDQQEEARRAAKAAFRETTRELYHSAYDEYRNAKRIRGVGLFRTFFEYESGQILNTVRGVLAGNIFGGFNAGDPRPPGVVRCVINFFTVGPLWLMSYHPVYFVLFSLVFLTLWAIFGGAIARIAAVHVARDEKLSVRAALQFSIGKFLSFVSAPLIPLIIVLLVGLVPILAGLIGSIPVIGPIMLGLFFILVLAAGFVMTLVLLGTFGGFNLMYPTIAVEGSDSFDAISRSFSYVYARPWRMIFYTLVAIIYGALCYVFVRLFVGLMLMLTHLFVDFGSVAEAPSTEPLWQVMWSGPIPRLSYDIDFLTLRWDQDAGAALVAFWVYLVIGMVGAFVISFYFSSNTIIYYLMRREVDATEPDDVYLEQSDEDFGESIPPQPGVVAESGSTATDEETRAGIVPPPKPESSGGGEALSGGEPG